MNAEVCARSSLIIGFIAGVIAKFLMPGPNEPSGFILATILGIVGAFVAAYLGASSGLVSGRPRRWADRSGGRGRDYSRDLGRDCQPTQLNSLNQRVFSESAVLGWVFSPSQSR